MFHHTEGSSALLSNPMPSHSITFALSDSLCITNVACTKNHSSILLIIMAHNIYTEFQKVTFICAISLVSVEWF